MKQLAFHKPSNYVNKMEYAYLYVSSVLYMYVYVYVCEYLNASLNMRKYIKLVKIY